MSCAKSQLEVLPITLNPGIQRLQLQNNNIRQGKYFAKHKSSWTRCHHPVHWSHSLAKYSPLISGLWMRRSASTPSCGMWTSATTSSSPCRTGASSSRRSSSSSDFQTTKYSKSPTRLLTGSRPSQFCHFGKTFSRSCLEVRLAA